MHRKPVLTVHTYLHGYLESVCKKLGTREDTSSFRGLMTTSQGPVDSLTGPVDSSPGSPVKSSQVQSVQSKKFFQAGKYQRSVQ